MTERDRERSGLLPPASDAFTRAILDGAEAIYRHERRFRRRARLALAAAAVALIGIGLGVALDRLSAPRPDTTVLTVNPDSVVKAGDRGQSAEQPSPTPGVDATPEPENAPEATVKSRIDPESGWEYLLDDGPFEPGEWLVVTDADGCMSYGLYIAFRENPSAQARSVELTAGMRVRYSGEAENGFASVNFAGLDGYVELKNLRRGADVPVLDEEREWRIDMAELFMIDILGKMHVFNVYDDAEGLACYALQKLLETMAPLPEGMYPDAPYGGLLLVRYQDAENPMTFANGAERFVEVRYAMSTDGVFMPMTEDGTRYFLPDSQDRFFWSVFPGAEDVLWRVE